MAKSPANCRSPTQSLKEFLDAVKIDGVSKLRGVVNQRKKFVNTRKTIASIARLPSDMADVAKFIELAKNHRNHLRRNHFR